MVGKKQRLKLAARFAMNIVRNGIKKLEIKLVKNKLMKICKTVNPDDAQTCFKCGAQLGESQSDAPVSNVQSHYVQDESHGQNESQSAVETMGFKDAIRVCMREKYASFKGRASRA